jgi:CheY-like chemotaxis protein
VLALLAGFGFGVDVAKHGAEAVERVREGDPALVLMNLQMPRIAGLEATRRSVACPARRNARPWR